MTHLAVFEKFVDTHDWINFLAETTETRSNTSVCFTVDLPEDKVKALAKLLEKEEVAFDCASYRDAPPGLRFWCGSTVEIADVEIVAEWIDWAYKEVR